MKRHVLAAGLLTGATWLMSTTANASDFYLFPVAEIAGVSAKVDPKTRPLIDARVRALLTETVQRQVIDNFRQAVVATYPQSAVHARQVSDVRRGVYRYMDAPVCADGFTVSVRNSYAATLGLTRGSWYELEREGGRVELLIPITLNLQLVKPDMAKVVYSISETLYSPFIFTKDELATPAAADKIANTVTSGLNRQITDLVQKLKTNFNPKGQLVKVVGRSEGVLVVDQGFETGFRPEDELIATEQQSGKESLFRVLSVGSGYAVLKLLEGSASTGSELNFTFESPADDSRKPRLMPLTSNRPDQLWSHAVTDLFTKEIGFNAGFQIAPVDATFNDVMSSIRAEANCVPWDKYPSTQQIFEARQDAPDYFVRFNLTRSAVTREAGMGNVKTVDSFMTSAAAQVVNARGHVLFSEIGHDTYRLERTGGVGLSMSSAQEVSLKNATTALAKRFVEGVVFEPGEFRITAVDNNRLVASGLSVPEGTVLAYEVLRPLDVQVRGKPTFWQLSLGEGTQPPTLEGDGTAIGYSKLDVAPRTGDILRVLNMPRKGQTRVAECEQPYRAPGSAALDEVLPLVRHAAYRSNRHQMVLTDPIFYQETNELLDAGFFKLRVQAPAASDTCMKPGYLVKLETSRCEEGNCSAQILAATTLILEKASTRIANFVQAEKVNYSGFAESQGDSFMGFKAYESAIKNVQKLVEKLNLSN
jgi:hypothetical protein